MSGFGEYSSVPNLGLHTDACNEQAAEIVNAMLDQLLGLTKTCPELSEKDVREQVLAYIEANLIPED